MTLAKSCSLAVAGLLLIICPAPAADSNPEPLPNLFLKNDAGLDQEAHFLVVQDQQGFDKLFGHATVMWQKKKMPPPDFTKQVVVAAIHQGKFYTEYNVQSVTNDNTVIVLRYATQKKQTPATTYACPLILTLPRGGVTAVNFVENGQSVATVKF